VPASHPSCRQRKYDIERLDEAHRSNGGTFTDLVYVNDDGGGRRARLDE
jgi:hypothetical protein